MLDVPLQARVDFLYSGHDVFITFTNQKKDHVSARSLLALQHYADRLCAVSRDVALCPGYAGPWIGKWGLQAKPNRSICHPTYPLLAGGTVRQQAESRDETCRHHGICGNH